MWRCAIVKRSVDQLSTDDLIPENLVWLPQGERPFTFRADPFGLWRDGKLHIFVEYFDYRDLTGKIELLVYDEGLDFIRREIVLQEPWHLSYPFVFEADGETWMLPEARQSGTLTLYRAADFPRAWEPAVRIDAAKNSVDGTLVFDRGRWWLFQAIVRRGAAPMSDLRIFSAEKLRGPWRSHPLNPVLSGLSNTRPAGTPQIREGGGVDLPVQDCSRTYGGAVRRLKIHRLDETRFDAETLPWLEPVEAFGPYSHGLHTISAAGPISLIDCKRVDRSITGTLIWRRGRFAQRKL